MNNDKVPSTHPHSPDAADSGRVDGDVRFACWLIDHYERELVTEESVQQWLNDYRASPAALAAQPQSAASPVGVPDGWRETILRVLSALDVATGDSDPNITADLTDDEVRDEYPEVWAMQQLSAMLTAPSATPEGVPSERCEGGTAECGTVEHWDSEGVPLCARCWGELADEAATPEGETP